MSKSNIGRRGAIKRALTVLGAAVVVPTALAACGGEEDAALACDDTSGLPAAATATRTGQNYVDSSPNADQNCANCNFFTAAEGCGTCTVIQGPIHPDGYCDLWVAQTGS